MGLTRKVGLQQINLSDRTPDLVKPEFFWYKRCAVYS